MGALNNLEKQLEGVFKGMPKLSDSSKESLAKAWPWLALIFGILQLWAAWLLYDLTRVAERLNDLVNSVSPYYTGRAVGLSSSDKMVIYLGIILLVVDAVILLMAYPELKKRSRRGWDLIFLSAVINAVYAIVQLFTHDRGVGSFIGSLIGSFIAFYLLFQVREKFGGRKSAPTS